MHQCRLARCRVNKLMLLLLLLPVTQKWDLEQRAEAACAAPALCIRTATS